MKDNDKLQVILKEQGIEKSDVAKMVEAFGGPFEEAGAILETYKELKVTKESDVEGMAEAREKRLLLKKARTTVENKRKELKADIVKQGKAIDSVARFVKEEIEPAEQYLETQEKFAELAQAERAAKLKAKRVEQLMQYTDDLSVYNLDAMTDEQHESLLAALKSQHEAKLAEAKRLEDERIAKDKADREAAEAQAAENAKLKAEAEARDKADREAEAARQAEAKKAADEQAKKDAAAQAERDRIQKEANDKLATERAEREKLEQEKRDREAEAARAEEARKAEEAAALLAPDKEKLFALAKEIAAFSLPAVKSNKAQSVITRTSNSLAILAEKLNQAAKEL